MKVKIKLDNGKPYGIELTAQTFAERNILKRFWDGGAKLNSMTNDDKIEFTFADLIEKMEKDKP